MDDEELLDALAKLYEKASIESYGIDIINIGELTIKEVDDFNTHIGKNLKGFKKIIKFNSARHIVKTHGKSYETLNSQKQIESEHFSNIPNIIKNYNSIEFQPKDHKKGKYQDCILLTKDNYSVVLEIIYGNKELTLKTMWLNK